jgi:hypothetical protein
MDGQRQLLQFALRRAEAIGYGDEAQHPAGNLSFLCTVFRPRRAKNGTQRIENDRQAKVL